MRPPDASITPNWGGQEKFKVTRELNPHENDRLVYEISGETVWMLALVHTARQWPLVRD
jgi:toxin ParE1/3/4